MSQSGPPVNGQTLYSVHVGRGGGGGGGGGLSTAPFFNAQSPGGGADPTTAGLYPGSMGYAYQVGGPPGLGGRPGVVIVGAENWITEPGSANTPGGMTPMLPAGTTRSLPSTPPASADDYWDLTTAVPIDGLTQT